MKTMKITVNSDELDVLCLALIEFTKEQCQPSDMNEDEIKAVKAKAENLLDKLGYQGR
jgi:hypothetical protein